MVLLYDVHHLHVHAGGGDAPTGLSSSSGGLSLCHCAALFVLSRDIFACMNAFTLQLETNMWLRHFTVLLITHCIYAYSV